MIPAYYFEVICCPKCKGSFEENASDKLTCIKCFATYQVIDDIPILLDEPEDKVSQVIKAFYDSAWQRNETGLLKAKILHEDMSMLGQRYYEVTEERFLYLFKEGGRFFFDAASGGKPRVAFGANFSYHICLDFSLDGLMECKRLLGGRAICIVGSLLNLPIKNSICDGVLASHCIYHIDKDLQSKALLELFKVLHPEKQMLIFYANPDCIEHLILRKIINTLRKKENKWYQDNFYYHAHSIKFMLDIMHTIFNNSSVAVKPLRMFTKLISKKLFKLKPLGPFFYGLLTCTEKHILHNRGFYMCSYV